MVELRVFNSLGDLLLNAEVVGRVLNGTASKSECDDIEWRVEQLSKQASDVLQLCGGMLPTLDLEEIDSSNYMFDSTDVLQGFGALMQMASGLLVALPQIRSACADGFHKQGVNNANKEMTDDSAFVSIR